MELAPRKVIGGHYEVICKLGGGGFGEIYLARDTHLPDRPLRVVKRLRPRHSDTEYIAIAQRLFDTEAQVLYQLGTHDRIPQLFAHFEEGKEFYLVQEYVEGESLTRELIPGQPLPEDTVLSILEDILDVLAFVHDRQVIHRDIKPDKIIRRSRDGHLVLIDFGIVKQLGNPNRDPQTGILSGVPAAEYPSDYTIAVGTQGFMPVEQAQGSPKFSSDVYAVGMLGIQALTGISADRLPKNELMEIQWRDRARVSAEVGDAIDTMVCYDFRQRYPNASAALEAVRGTIARRVTAPILGMANEVDTGLSPRVPALSSTTLEVPASPQSTNPPHPARPRFSLKLWSMVGAGCVVGGVAIAALVNSLGSVSRSPELALSRPRATPDLAAANAFTPWQTFWGHTGWVYAVAFSPAGTTVVSGSLDRTIREWNPATGKVLRTMLAHRDRVYDLAFSPDGKWLATASADRTVSLWEAATGKKRYTLVGHRDRIYTVIFSHNGRYLATCSGDRAIRLWDARTGKLARELMGHSDRVNDLSFSPDDTILASASSDKTIRLWDVATGRTIGNPINYGDIALSVVFSPSGKLLASGIDDGTIRLWHVNTNRTDTLMGHRKGVHALAFSPDGKQLASGSADETMRVWDLASTASQVLRGHQGGVASVAFSPDGQQLASGSLDNTVRVWKRP